MTSTSSKETQTASKKVQQEMVTPHKLTVAILIRCFCQYRESEEFKQNNNARLKVKYRRDFCILILKLLQSHDLKLGEIKQLFFSTNKLPPTVLHQFDDTLHELYTSGIGSLLDVVDSLNKTLSMNDLNQSDINGRSILATSNTICKSSVIGYFLRRFIVHFEKLTFSEVSGVYQAFIRYYNQWKNCYQLSYNNETKVEDWYIDHEQWSRRQAELFLATQAALLHNDEQKALPPPDLQQKISSILKSNPDLAEAHFMSFLNYLRVEEFCGAIDSLYHCFDRRIDPDVKCFNDEKSKEHRFAALNLAILHHHFGHTEEALAALKEAIKISHEANDNMCLQHALSWLFRLSNVNKDNLIVQCIIKTFELSINYTTSLALQTFAHYGSAKISVKPAVIFETLNKSDMLNCQHYYQDLIFNNHKMKSALWQLFGKTDMSSLWCQTLLYLNIDTTTHTTAHYGESYCLAVCNLANIFLMQGEYNLVVALISYVKIRYQSEPYSKIWKLCENNFVFTRALYHEKWVEAESAAQKIMVLDKWEGYLKLAELYYYKQEYEEANKCIDILTKLYNYDEHLNDGKFCLLRAKILLSEIQFASTHSTYLVSLSNTVISLLDAEKAELAYHISLIHLHIANVLLSLGLTSQALKVLTEPKCMVEILANGGCYDRARAMLLYVKCVLADSQKLEPIKRREVILDAAQSLDKVKSNFEKGEAYSRMKDVLYLQAQLYNTLNMNPERNKCAIEYKLLNEEYTTKNIHTLTKYL